VNRRTAECGGLFRRNGVALLGLVTLGLVIATPLCAAQFLPFPLQQSLLLAAADAQRTRSADALYFNADRRPGNDLLNGAVLNAIDQRPDLTAAIVAEAVRLAPENRDYLVAKLSLYLPGFAGVIAAAASGQPVMATPAVVEPVPAPVLVPAPTPLPLAPSVSSDEIELALTPAPVYPDAVVTVVESELWSRTESGSLADRPEGWPILPKEGGADGYADDPLEGLNKAFFYINGTLDFLFFEPLARAYGFVMPDIAKSHIRNAFDNLGLPATLGNDLLQLEVEAASETLARFAINSTLGVVGLFDVAAEWGILPHSRDFGQTLYSYGVGEDIYLVLPLFGPSSIRDAIGFGVDGLMDPRNYLIESTGRIMLNVGQGIVVREAVIDPVDFLKENAKDKYDAVRAWSWQQRQIELQAGCEHRAIIVCPGP
jgi:phospholipid-binding lipoprotein MlaA